MARTVQPEVIEENRQKIFKAAKTILERDGFNGLTTKAICKEAGISNGKFFYHFESKDELLRYYLLDGYEHYLADHFSADEAGADFKKKVISLYDCYISYVCESGLDFVSAYYSTSNQALDTHVSFDGGDTINQTMAHDHNWLVEAADAGYLTEEADPATITNDCCSIIKGVVFGWCASKAGFDPVAESRRILNAYLNNWASEKYFAEFGRD